MDICGEIKNCKRCVLSETRKNALCGEGNIKSGLMLVAQAPGETEDSEGKMFIGPAGVILNDLLSKAGINRDEVYITNLVKCMLPGYRKPKQDEIDSCEKYLDEEIEMIKPNVISTLGYYATKYIFKKYELDMPKEKKAFTTVTGRLHYAGEVKVYPLRHPAALLHNSSLRLSMESDYRKLRVYARECKWYSCCPMKYFYEKGRLDGKWIDRYCRGDWDNCIRYWKEENNEYHPDEMLSDGTIDKNLSVLNSLTKGGK